jgi:hypothetical protein
MKSLLITLAILNACGFTFCLLTTRNADNGEAQMLQAWAFIITTVLCVVVDLLAVMIFVIVRHFVR